MLKRASWRDLLTDRDPILLHAGRAGELLVARIRLSLTLALLLVPFASVLIDPWDDGHRVGLGVLLAATAVALVAWMLVRRGLAGPWLGPASTALDISLVSAALIAFLVLDEPNTAVNSRVVFDCYFIAIAATCLRYDIRLCLLAGALAVFQYFGIALYADAHWDLQAAVYRPLEYGIFDWGTQISRLVLLAVAAVLAATVVARGRVLRRLSSIDRMTGVYNRGFFDERFAAEISRARRQSETVALVMIDVDYFKRFNDNYGHSAGDAGLRAMTTLIRHSLRRSDIVARYGGEEFVIVMPVTTAAQAMDKMEAIREALAQLPIRLPKQQTTALLTISAGVAIFPGDGATADELVDTADDRLFQAKQRGRNRVVGPPPERESGKAGERDGGGVGRKGYDRRARPNDRRSLGVNAVIPTYPS